MRNEMVEFARYSRMARRFFHEKSMGLPRPLHSSRIVRRNVILEIINDGKGGDANGETSRTETRCVLAGGNWRLIIPAVARKLPLVSERYYIRH
jgi:hypothetical protein